MQLYISIISFGLPYTIFETRCEVCIDLSKLAKVANLDRTSMKNKIHLIVVVNPVCFPSSAVILHNTPNMFSCSLKAQVCKLQMQQSTSVN